MFPLKTLIIAATALPWAASAQVLIHEVMASNGGSYADEDGDFEDWIELHNPGASAVDLDGYGLSDDPEGPFRWTFGPTVIGPGEYLVVWASGKDRQAGVPVIGLRREVYSGIGGSDLSSLINHWSFPDHPSETGTVTELFEAPSDVTDNYGQRISGLLQVPETGNYRFWLASDDEGRLALSPDENPANAGIIASVPQWTGSREWDRFFQQRSAQIHLQSGQRYYLEALMKEGTGGDNLAVRWQKPDGTIEGPLPASHFSSGISQVHTNFSISAGGEPLQLTAPGGAVVDSVPVVALPRDVSYGRSPDDPAQWLFFAGPTPGASNTTAGVSEVVWDTPRYSAESGFHADEFELELQTTAPGTEILYTLDGSEPNPAHLGGTTYSYKDSYPANSWDPIGPMLTGSFETLSYEGPITIRNRSNALNRLAQRNTTFNTSASGYAPITRVFKGTVVRSRLVKDNALPGPVVTRSYFVTREAGARYSLPVLSLSMDEDALFDHFSGNYTAGEDYEAWRAANSGSPNGGTPANYTRRGRHTERPLHLEAFFPAESASFSQNLGFRMHGGWSRANPQKSLRLYAKRGYDEADTMARAFIPGLTGNATGEPIESFKRLVLRNSGNDHDRTRIQDAFIQRLVAPLGVDQQGYRPAVHFINGEYWGLIGIRERIDRYFINSHHGIPPEHVALLSNNADVSEGTQADREDFISLRDYIADNPMSDPARYAVAEAQMDMRNFILYHVAQIYANNRDWPHNNIAFWRSNVPGPGPTNDGRWRWVIFDTDFGFGHSGGYSTNTLAHATNTNDDWSKVMLRKLLENPEFRRTFINAFADHMAVTFRSARVNAVVDEMAAEIEPYMPEHAERWRNQGSSGVGFIKDFGAFRPSAMRQHLTSHFSLGGLAGVTLDVAGVGGGHLVINTLTLKPGTPGLPNPALPFPWTGTYFQGVPVTVTAIPDAGHRFIGWQEYPAHDLKTITLDPGGGLQLTAMFEETPVSELPRLVHFWDFDGGLADRPAQTAGGGFLTVDPATTTEVLVNSPAQGFASPHLRVNSPIGATVELALPTSNFDEISLEFLTRRSGSGAGQQTLSYTTDGSVWTELESYAVADADPQPVTFDFSAIAGTADTPDFAVRITFAQGTGGTAGNNRFDDISLIGTPVEGANTPPQLVAEALPPNGTPLRAGGPATSFDLSAMFTDADQDELTFAVSSAPEWIAEAEVSDGWLTVSGLAAGESLVTVSADDGENPPVSASFRVLVQPAAHPLAGGAYQFAQWSAASPAFTYPDHMIFLQSEQDDPTLETALERAYAIPAIDAASPDDADFPYAATSRTRINGLGENGISFINTGRARDLGAAVLALDTRGLSEAAVAFTAGTVAPNARIHALRLQYRIGGDGAFTDVMEGSLPVEYLRSETAGDTLEFGPIELPPEMLGHEYVQLAWRYHHVGGDSGPRSELRLDDITLTRGVPGFAVWRELQFPDPAELADPAVSGPDADPLGIGVTNLMRYALEIDVPGDLASRLPALRGDPADQLLFRFPFDQLKSDITYRVEVSPDLSDWSEHLFDSSESPEATPVNGWMEIPALERETEIPGRRYYRLKVGMRAVPTP